MDGSRSEKGMTLVEVMVALLIFSIVLGTVYTLYLQGVITWRHGESKLEVQDHLRLAMDRMSRELRTALYLDNNNLNQNNELTFFIVDKNGNPARVRYYLRGTQLLREWQGTSNPLASNITGLNLSYLPAGVPLNKESLVSIALTGETEDGKTLALHTKVKIRLVCSY